MIAPPFFRSFLARVLVGGLSGAALIACTSALGNFSIDDSLANDGGKESGGGGLADGASGVDGAGSSDGGGGGTLDGTIPPNRCGTTEPFHFVFVTAYSTPGNIGNGGTKAIPTASAICAEAAKGKLPGQYVAWLSTDNAAPGDILTQPLYLPDCTRVIADPTKYKQSPQPKLENPIDIDENGSDISGQPVWTATTPLGAYVGGTIGENTCANWSDPADGGVSLGAKGIVGNTSEVDVKWTNNGQQNCVLHAHLYCLQVK